MTYSLAPSCKEAILKGLKTPATNPYEPLSTGLLVVALVSVSPVLFLDGVVCFSCKCQVTCCRLAQVTWKSAVWRAGIPLRT